MKALFANHQRAYIERVKDRAYTLPSSESVDSFSTDQLDESRSWSYVESDEPGEDFVLKNIQNVSHAIRPRSAAVRGDLSVAQLTPLSKVPYVPSANDTSPPNYAHPPSRWSSLPG